MSVNNSYEFSNVVRDLQGAYDKLVASQPTLISLVRRGVDATSTKHEWNEEALTPVATAITAFGTDGDGTTFDVTSTVGFSVGDVLRCTSTADVTYTEVVKVTSITDANTFVISRDYGGSTGVTFVVGDKLSLISSPRGEGTDAGTGDGAQATAKYNYTQIEDAIALVSKTAQAIKIHGVTNLLNEDVERKMLALLRRQNNTLIHGIPVVRSGSDAGMAGGILHYLAGGNVTAVSGALTSTKVNEAFEAIFDDGAYSNNFVLLCAENQARKISAFNTTGSNPVTQIMYPATQTGSFVQTFVSDLGAANGFTARVYVDPNMPKDQVAICDMNKIEVNYLRALTDEDATANGGDYFKRRLLHEYTFTIRDGQKGHALLTALTV